MVSKTGQDEVTEVTDSFSKLPLEERKHRAREAIVELELEMRVADFESPLEWLRDELARKRTMRRSDHVEDSVEAVLRLFSIA